MRRLRNLCFSLLVLMLLFSPAVFAEANVTGAGVPVYRLYNFITGEHLYTPDVNEYNTLSLPGNGWRKEGKGWGAPASGTAVYRLYHAGVNDHLYTTDTNEVNVLTNGRGWQADNNGKPLFFSGGTISVYRLYHPGTRRHHLTADSNENNVLGGRNWNQEGVKLTALEPGEPAAPNNEPMVAQPGLRTVQNFLATALQPVGITSYIWGGGWNEADNAAGTPAVTIGISPRWKAFFDQQNASYDYNRTRFQIYDGLDCSGFVGWSVYNLLNTQNGGKGEVYWADDQAEWFAKNGYGTYTPYGQVRQFLPGDVVSLNNDGHVYICIGQCPDGSVVLVHSSPPGVMITGTQGPNGEQTQATQLSHTYMQRYYPVYFSRYSNQLDRPYASYITRSSKMTWGDNFVGDPDGIRNHDAAGVLKILFNEH